MDHSMDMDVPYADSVPSPYFTRGAESPPYHPRRLSDVGSESSSALDQSVSRAFEHTETSAESAPADRPTRVGEAVRMAIVYKDIILDYPTMSTGEPDWDVQKLALGDFTTLRSSADMYKLPAPWTIRFLVATANTKFNPDFKKDRDLLIGSTRGIIRAFLQDIRKDPGWTAEDVKVRVSSSEARTLDEGGVPAAPEDNEKRTYLDITLPKWSKSIAMLITELNLSTTEVSVTWAGKDDISLGLGPAAPVQYQLARCEINDDYVLRDGRSFSYTADLSGFREATADALKSATTYRDYFHTRVEIVGFAGGFEHGDESLTWDRTITTLFRVPLLPGNPLVVNAEAISLFVGHYKLKGGIEVRNQHNHRFQWCEACRTKAKYIHNGKNHRCDRCNQYGHVPRNCNRYNKKSGTSALDSVTTVGNSQALVKRLGKRLADALKADAAEAEAEERRVKRLRTQWESTQ